VQQDGLKLDLQEGENLRRLLECGIKSKDPVRKPADDDYESEYSSQVLQMLGNTKLWKAIQRKREDILESDTIFVTNRVERDSNLLGSLSMLAFERAMQDRPIHPIVVHGAF